MPNPLFLQVMGVSIHEYNAYSPAKKARFQKAAAEKLAHVHQTDAKAYDKLTADTASQSEADAEEAALSAEEDKENS
jgi:hypothetical protein